MYLVVFTAKLANPDNKYHALAQKLRQLAFEEYACLGFQATNEDGLEIAISKWESLADIQRWRENPLHKSAQKLAKRWYTKWNVTITEVIKEYES